MDELEAAYVDFVTQRMEDLLPYYRRLIADYEDSSAEGEDALLDFLLRRVQYNRDDLMMISLAGIKLVRTYELHRNHLSSSAAVMMPVIREVSLSLLLLAQVQTLDDLNKTPLLSGQELKVMLKRLELES
jgi:hypothetical protein